MYFMWWGVSIAKCRPESFLLSLTETNTLPNELDNNQHLFIELAWLRFVYPLYLIPHLRSLTETNTLPNPAKLGLLYF